MHLTDTFIQSDLQCIQAILFFYQYVCSLGIEPTTVCAANAMLYHWATETPYKRFKMKLQSNLNCHICNTTSSGTFLHMFWECPVVISLWTHVNLVLASLLRIDWSVNPSLCLLNDDSGLCISSMQKRMLLSRCTQQGETRRMQEHADEDILQNNSL